ncbi:hypothetical protein V7034_27970 [Priestia megaterium]|uniref:hypothetical protein n=1 Tax=Priestia megaterium TaxID=1404 RepID=UPI002FFED69F
MTLHDDIQLSSLEVQSEERFTSKTFIFKPIKIGTNSYTVNDLVVTALIRDGKMYANASFSVSSDGRQTSLTNPPEMRIYFQNKDKGELDRWRDVKTSGHGFFHLRVRCKDIDKPFYEESSNSKDIYNELERVRVVIPAHTSHGCITNDLINQDEEENAVHLNTNK